MPGSKSEDINKHWNSLRVAVKDSDNRGRSKSRHRDAGTSRHRSLSKFESAVEGLDDDFSMASMATSLAAVALEAKDAFDMLEVGKIYQVADFTGSCPAMGGAHLHAITNDGKFPIFKHENTTLEVKSVDASGHKHLRFNATVITPKQKGDLTGAGGNCNYGATGTYGVEIVIKKDVDGKIICTSLVGTSGKIAIPGFVNIALKAVNFFGSLFSKTLPWDDVSSYNTGSAEQKMHVELAFEQDGTLTLKTVIDPAVLTLEGAAKIMLGVSNGLGIACPAILEGRVDLQLDKKHRKEVGEHKLPNSFVR